MTQLIMVDNIYHEDCLKFMRRAYRQEFFVDVIVTSPPYNIDKGYNMYNDKISRRQYLKWMNKVAKLSMPILRDNGSFFLNIGGTLIGSADTISSITGIPGGGIQVTEHNSLDKINFIR